MACCCWAKVTDSSQDRSNSSSSRTACDLAPSLHQRPEQRLSQYRCRTQLSRTDDDSSSDCIYFRRYKAQIPVLHSRTFVLLFVHIATQPCDDEIQSNATGSASAFDKLQLQEPTPKAFPQANDARKKTALIERSRIATSKVPIPIRIPKGYCAFPGCRPQDRPSVMLDAACCCAAVCLVLRHLGQNLGGLNRYTVRGVQGDPRAL